MPRTHNDRSRDILAKYAEDPEYALTLSQKARERWAREYRAEVSALLDEFEAGRPQRQILIAMRAMNHKTDLDDDQRKFVRALRDAMKALTIFNSGGY
jgi:hypothetical protein